MPSVLDLVHESSSELKDRARNSDSVKVGLTKFEHIDAFADEELGEQAEVVLKANRPDLVTASEEVGLDHEDISVPDLKEALLQKVCGFRRDQGMPYPTGNSADRMPTGKKSHFEDPEVRQSAIEQAAQTAAKKAVRQQITYHVLESLRPKDKSDPLRVVRAYGDHHEKEIIVATVSVPAVHWPIKTASGSSLARP